MENFSFYTYSLDFKSPEEKQIDSRFRRGQLFRKGLDKLLGHMEEKQRKDFERLIFFIGQSFYSARPIPGLEGDKLPLTLVPDDEGDVMKCVSVSHFTAPEVLQGTKTESNKLQTTMDNYRCQDCSSTFTSSAHLTQHCRDTGHSPVFATKATVSATPEVFVAYVNVVLEKAMQERMARWGRDFVDPKSGMPATDRRGNDLGINIFRAYSCTFGLIQDSLKKDTKLALTVDLRAKVIRSKSVLDSIYEGRSMNSTLRPQDQQRATREWVGQVVIYKNEKRCKWITAESVVTSSHLYFRPLRLHRDGFGLGSQCQQSSDPGQENIACTVFC
jgi:hypothetical protein